MAASPSSSRRNRHRPSASHGLSSSSNNHLPASTLPISTSSAPSSSNPLLQPDITPSSLLSQFTPQQLATHLDALKDDLEGHEAEMKRLINSRYSDILSVGGTVSAMKGSSIYLHDKMAQVSQRLITPHQPWTLHSNAEAAKEEKADHEEERVRNVASLLTIQQEAPEEIWTILDAVSTAINQLHSSSEPEKLLTLLRCARSLSIAISLYDATRLAGWELDGTSDHQEISRLFPYPLESRSTTLSSIKSEIRSAFERIIQAATIRAGKTAKTQASQEALFRLITLGLLAFVRLDVLQPKGVSNWYLTKRRESIEEELKLPDLSAGESKLGDPKAIAKVMSGLRETIVTYTRLFGCSHGGKGSLFNSLLVEMMSDRSSRELTSPKSSLTSEYASLLPPKPLSSLSLLSASSHVISMLHANSGLRDWTPFFEVKSDSSGQAAQQNELEAWVNSVLATELSQEGGHWATVTVIEHASLGSLRAISKARRRLARQVDPSMLEGASTNSADVGPSRLIQNIYQHLDKLLSDRAVTLAAAELTGWTTNVMREIKALEQATHHGHAGSEFYDDIFVASPISIGEIGLASTSGRSFHSAHSNIPGLRSALGIFLSALHEQWDKYQVVKERYFETCFEDVDSAIAREEQERRVWINIERRCWEKLVEDVEHVMDDSRATLSSRASGSDRTGSETRRDIQLLSIAVLELLRLPVDGPASPFDDDKSRERYLALSQRVRRSRDGLLNSTWKNFVVSQAGSLLFTPDDSSPSPGDVDLPERYKPSMKLVKVLYFLDVESGQVIPSQSQREVEGGALEVGTVVDLMRSLLLWLSVQLEQNESLRPTVKRADIETLAALLSVNNHVGEGEGRDTQEQQQEQEVREASSSILSMLNGGKAQITSQHPGGPELLTCLSPYALLFGRIRGISPPSPASPQQQQRRWDNGAATRPPALFKIAPVKARVRGVEVR